MENKKIFVASPYNHNNEEVKKTRLLTLKDYCLKLFKEGASPISPLIMGLSIAEVGFLPTDTETWANFSKTLLKGCDEIHILCLEDWELSTGVNYERLQAEKLGITIKYIYQ